MWLFAGVPHNTNRRGTFIRGTEEVSRRAQRDSVAQGPCVSQPQNRPHPRSPGGLPAGLPLQRDPHAQEHLHGGYDAHLVMDLALHIPQSLY